MIQTSERGQLLVNVRLTLWGWPLWLAAAVGIIAAILAIAFDERVELARTFLFVLITASIALGGFAIARGIALRDKLQSEEYGEIIRTIDPDQSRLLLPYFTHASIAGVTVGVAVLAAVFGPVIENPAVKGLVVGIVAFFFAWTLLGFFQILRNDFLHSRNMSRIQALKEKAGRIRRSADNNS